jgi:hypothetical protein
MGCQGQYLNTAFFSEFDDYLSSEGLASLRCYPPGLAYAPTPFAPDTPITPEGLAEAQRDFGLRFLAIDRVHLAEPWCTTLAARLTDLLARGAVLGADERWTILDLGTSS